MLSDYLSLMKLRIVALLVFVSGVAAMVSGTAIPPGDLLLYLVAAGILSSAGASTLNHYVDRHFDAIMARTRRRPVAAGRIRGRNALAMGVILVSLSVPFSIMLGPVVVLTTLTGAFVYVVVYTLWLKPTSPFSVVVGGLAGSCAVLSGWFAVTPSLSPAAMALATLVFVWTPAHFWSFAMVHEEDYRRTGIPVLGVVIGAKEAAGCILLHSVLLVPVSLLLYPSGTLGNVYLIGAIMMGALYIASTIRLYRTPTRERAWSSYKLSGVYLLGTFLFMVLDLVLGPHTFPSR